MTKLEINLQKLIDKEGFDDAKSMLGLTTRELIDKSNCRIDLSMVNDIIEDLIKENVIPKTYKNCRLSYDGFGGTLDWWCDWSDDSHNDYQSEETYTLSTPFWVFTDGIPVDTNSYDAVDLTGYEISFTDGDFMGNVEPYTFLKWKDGFENIALLERWVRRFYLPQVYNAISEHLKLYRNLTD
jgi:hypothetical protein